MSSIQQSVSVVAVRRSALSGTRVHDALWRITRSSGEVMGYVERLDDPRGDRFRARRLHASHRRFSMVGEFWRLDDAIDALRFG